MGKADGQKKALKTGVCYVLSEVVRLTLCYFPRGGAIAPSKPDKII